VSSHAIGENETPSLLGNRKLKVVRVVTSSECVPWHLGNALARAPEDFDVYVVGQDVLRHREKFPGVKFVDVDLDRKVNPMSDLFSLFKLCRVFLKYKPDIVHSIMPKAGLLSAIAGFICRVPVRVHTFTGQVWVTKKGMARAGLYACDRLVNFLNTVCLTDSPSQSLFLFRHKIHRAGKPLPVLSKGSLSGIEMSRFNSQGIGAASASLRKSLGIEPADFVFSFIARKTRDKGAIDIIKSFQEVRKLFPATKLLFVGPDETGGEIEELMRSNPDIFNNVKSVGRVDNHEVYLAISSVLCLPSYREGFGTIVIDAAALGVPTIGSNIVGLVDSIEDGETGILVPAGDLGELAKAMLIFLNNPERRVKMGLAAKHRVEAYFTADQLYGALKNFYFECHATVKGDKALGRMH
jgi:glycosyltransferase involved in cell wall biosynthesis